MTSMASHDEIEELLGAYALDAVDGDERAMVEDHLRDCPRCRDEVEAHREVAAHLSFAGASAPEGLWSRIASELEPAEPEPELGRLLQLRRARPRRRWMTPSLVAAAASIAILAGALGWQLHNQQTKVSNITRQLATSVGLNQAVRDASLDARSSKFALVSADGKVHVDAVVEPDGTGFLVPHKSLAALPHDQTYQLWGVVGNQRISLGLLGTKPDVVPFKASAPRLDALAITTERAGGVLQSAHAPVAAGAVAVTGRPTDETA